MNKSLLRSAKTGKCDLSFRMPAPLTEERKAELRDFITKPNKKSIRVNVSDKDYIQGFLDCLDSDLVKRAFAFVEEIRDMIPEIFEGTNAYKKEAQELLGFLEERLPSIICGDKIIRANRSSVEPRKEVQRKAKGGHLLEERKNELEERLKTLMGKKHSKKRACELLAQDKKNPVPWSAEYMRKNLLKK